MGMRPSYQCVTARTFTVRTRNHGAPRHTPYFYRSRTNAHTIPRRTSYSHRDENSGSKASSSSVTSSIDRPDGQYRYQVMGPVPHSAAQAHRDTIIDTHPPTADISASTTVDSASPTIADSAHHRARHRPDSDYQPESDRESVSNSGITRRPTITQEMGHQSIDLILVVEYYS